ncbi:phosphotransferase enzyme family protein [Falsigemmobacter intermedius]|uniref:Homoserine kinase n=1 Tax=Falsigemmobacter intermedius TaxID=1553448 RepID=A0A444MDJ9_9RHOB|nr:phosphotransferase [Falsigemmobacter intermedius]RWY42479.1 homoserine kinase [Falsigemmobacter intermedius]
MSAEAVEAAALWGARDLRPITERENAVYAITLPEGRPAALRLHRRGYQEPSAIRSELWWCAALAAAGAPVPAPLPALSGELLQQLSGGRLVSVIDWVEGEAIGAAALPLAGTMAAKEALMAGVGRLIATCHQATDGLSLPQGFTRPSWDAEGLAGENPLWGRFTDHPLLTSADRDILHKSQAVVFERAKSAQISGDYGLIHADVLRENVLSGPKGYSLIDFDDSGFGLRAYDPGTLLSQSLSEPGLPDLVQALCEGYRAVRVLDADLLPVMTLARCCASVGWVMTRLPMEHPVQKSHIARAVGFARKVLDGKEDPWA